MENGSVPSSSNGPAQLKLQQQVENLEQTVSDLTSLKSTVGVFGGLSSLGSVANAEIWLKKQLSDVGGSMPVDVYWYGDFADTVYASFASTPERDAATNKLTRAKIQLDNKAVWGRAEASLEVRACETFLSGLKKILVAWGFDRRLLKYEVKGSTKNLKVAGDIKVSVSIQGGRIQCEWEEGWKGKDELHSSLELKQLIAKVDLLLSGGGKGKGKSAFA